MRRLRQSAVPFGGLALVDEWAKEDQERQRTSLIALFKVQCRVVGALIMRELHTRYGRENVGYLWMIVEPALLAGAVAIIHSGYKTHYGSDVRPVPFAIVGYTAYYMFRSIVNRSEGTIESNQSLLYHRSVTILDLTISRAILEFLSVLFTMVLLLVVADLMGFGDLPVRWLFLLGGFVLMTWFCFSLSLIVTAITYDNRTAGRLIHPITYLVLPISGAFFALAWIPQPYRSVLYWFPMVQIYEMMRYGQFQYADYEYFSIKYIFGSCFVLTFVGLVLVRRVRAHVHLR